MVWNKNIKFVNLGIRRETKIILIIQLFTRSELCPKSHPQNLRFCTLTHTHTHTHIYNHFRLKKDSLKPGLRCDNRMRHAADDNCLPRLKKWHFLTLKSYLKLNFRPRFARTAPKSSLKVWRNVSRSWRVVHASTIRHTRPWNERSDVVYSLHSGFHPSRTRTVRERLGEQACPRACPHPHPPLKRTIRIISAQWERWLRHSFHPSSSNQHQPVIARERLDDDHDHRDDEHQGSECFVITFQLAEAGYLR